MVWGEPLCSLLCPLALGRANGSVSHPVALDEFETHDVLQLPKADGTRFQRPQQGFVQAQRALHDALQPAAGPQPHQVADLVAGHLSGKQKLQQCMVIPAFTVTSSSSSVVSLSLLLNSLTHCSALAVLQPRLF